MIDVLIVGGGAAGFFAAITIKEKHPELSVVILEKSNEVLSKVRVSGGGRCNVTNGISDVQQFVKNYPRGEKELRGPFQRFGNRETMTWFENKGVSLKIEPDGRVFPQSNSSESIVNCFLQSVETLKIQVVKKQTVTDFSKDKQGIWQVSTQDKVYQAEKLVITTGSSTKMWQILDTLGHTIIEPVPSLFTFHISDPKLHALMGVSQEVSLKIKDTSFTSQGMLLMTHWGVSGPAVLKLSAWAARELAVRKYRFILTVNWLKDKTTEQVLEEIKNYKTLHSKKNVFKNPMFGFTHRLWEYLVSHSAISEQINFADLSKIQSQNLAKTITEMPYEVEGKSTFKEEFVTAGGVDLKEIHFKTMESKITDNLYFAGEVLNIDAITGGFNFQNAWTTAWIISEAVS